VQLVVVAAAGSIPTFSTCPFFGRQCFRKRVLIRGDRCLQLVSIVLFTSVP
jgi:hypothetical protein